MEKSFYELVNRQFEGHDIEYKRKEVSVDAYGESFFFDSKEEALEAMSEVLQVIFDWNQEDFKVSLFCDSNVEEYVVTISEL